MQNKVKVVLLFFFLVSSSDSYVVKIPDSLKHLSWIDAVNVVLQEEHNRIVSTPDYNWSASRTASAQWDLLNFKNHQWYAMTIWYMLDDYLINEYGKVPSGLSGTYTIRDSILYLTQLEIGYSDINESPCPCNLKIPFDIIFKNAKDDSLKAFFFTGYHRFVCENCELDNDSGNTLLDINVEKGKITNYSIFKLICNSNKAFDSNGRFIERGCKYVYEDSSSIYEVPSIIDPLEQKYEIKESKIMQQNLQEFYKKAAPYYQKQRELEKAYRDSVEKVKP